jgi:hypothetical protein
MIGKIGKWEPAAAPSDQGDHDQDKSPVGRRRLLTGGGMVMAGVVGAGLATAAAGPASAAAGDPLLQDTVNDAGTSATPTELDADNDTTPAFIIANTGIDAANGGAGPNLRLTPSTVTGDIGPTASTAGGDLTATGEGLLWFTHNFGGTPAEIVPAPVHTEATSNVFAPLATPDRVLDTRSAAGRANIVSTSGNLDSTGRLKAGKTILINLDNLVYVAEVVFANITVTGMAGSGYLTVWSGTGTRPTASAINFGTSTLSNFVVSAVAEDTSTILNVIAIYAEQTTHVILDVAGFVMPGFEYSKAALAGTASAGNARLQRAQQAMRNASRA